MYNARMLNDALWTLVRLNQKARETLTQPTALEGAPDQVKAQFAKNHCTVRLDIGASTGKTHACVESVNTRDDAIVVVHSLERLKTVADLVTDSGKVFCPLTLRQRRMTVPRPLVVLVDEVSLFGEHDVDLVYSVSMGKVIDQTWILLG